MAELDGRPIGDHDPLMLRDAARLAFPDGSVGEKSLRRQRDAGTLECSRVAGRDYTTLAAIRVMMERCRVKPKVGGSAPSEATDTPAVALAAALAIARDRTPPSPKPATKRQRSPTAALATAERLRREGVRGLPSKARPAGPHRLASYDREGRRHHSVDLLHMGPPLVATIAHEHKAQTRAMEVQAEAKPLGKHGGDRKKVVDQGSDGDYLDVGRGTDYIASRLKRDHPEVLAASRKLS